MIPLTMEEIDKVFYYGLPSAYVDDANRLIEMAKAAIIMGHLLREYRSGTPSESLNDAEYNFLENKMCQALVAVPTVNDDEFWANHPDSPKDILIHDYPDWQPIKCSACDGKGQVANYGCGGDFEGPEECDSCNGTGRYFVHRRGCIAQYPGGPFLGQASEWEMNQLWTK